METEKLMSIGELFKSSWQMFKKGFWRLLAIMGIGAGINIGLIILLILMILISIFAGAINLPKFQYNLPTKFEPGAFQSSAIAIWTIAGLLSKFAFPLMLFLIFALFFLIVNYWISASLISAAVGISQNLGIRQAFKKAWQKLSSFVWINCLEGLIVILGLALFIVPGIIFMVWFMFGIYALISDDINGWQALKKSKELVSGYWWQVFGRIVLLQAIFIGSMILNYIMPGIGLLAGIFFNLFAVIYYYAIYQDLKRIKHSIAQTGA